MGREREREEVFHTIHYLKKIQMLLVSLLGMLKLKTFMKLTFLVVRIFFFFYPMDPSQIANTIAFIFPYKCCQMHQNFRAIYPP